MRYRRREEEYIGGAQLVSQSVGWIFGACYMRISGSGPHPRSPPLPVLPLSLPLCRVSFVVSGRAIGHSHPA